MDPCVKKSHCLKNKTFLAEGHPKLSVVINYVVKIKNPHEESYPFFYLVLSALSHCHPRENGDPCFSFFLDSRFRGNDTREMVACSLRVILRKQMVCFSSKNIPLLVRESHGRRKSSV